MSHIRHVTVDPLPLRAGENVTLTLEVDDPTAIASAKVYDPRGEELRLQRVVQDGTTVFRLVEPVPAGTDAGEYYATLVLTDTAGNVERKTMELQIE